MLDDWNISLAELETTASGNLAAALAAANVAYEDIDGVRLGIIETDLAFAAIKRGTHGIRHTRSKGATKFGRGLTLGAAIEGDELLRRP
jgi:hypothetical protein